MVEGAGRLLEDCEQAQLTEPHECQGFVIFSLDSNLEVLRATDYKIWSGAEIPQQKAHRQ